MNLSQNNVLKKWFADIDIEVAENILKARDKKGRFTKLAEIEAVTGVGVDKFIDLINTFRM